MATKEIAYRSQELQVQDYVANIQNLEGQLLQKKNDQDDLAVHAESQIRERQNQESNYNKIH